MHWQLYWTYPVRSLARGGQRTLFAIFSIAVGVMAIVALQLVGLSINDALTGNIIAANGGDLRIDSILVPLNHIDLATFTQLRDSGQITAYATSYEVPSGVRSATGSVVPADVVAVSPNFPLAGQADFTLPAQNLRIQDIVHGNAVAMNQLVASQLHAHIGDAYTIQTGDGQNVPITIAAIFQDGGAFHGPQIILSAATLNALAGPNGRLLAPRYTTITINAPAASLKGLESTLRQQFPMTTVTTAVDELRLRQQDVRDIRLFLQIVGLLALFIGGIGIINTMQVILRRRRLEIAMLKTMGYRQRHLYALFGLETGLLGVIGGLLGVSLGVGASNLVRAVVEQAFFLHLRVFLDIPTLLNGFAAGVLTALFFGLIPIAQNSQIRPLVVLREESGGNVSRILTGALFLLVSILFVILSATIIGNLRIAAIVVYGGAGVVLLIAGGFGALIRAIAALPVYDRRTWRITLSFILALLVSGLVGAGLYFALTSLNVNVLLANAEHGNIPAIAVPLGYSGLALAAACGMAVYLLATLINGIVMFAPRGARTSLKFAYRNLGRQIARTTTTLTALFVGVFGVAAIVLLGQGIKDTINQTIGSVFSHNLFVVASPASTAHLQSRLATLSGVDAQTTTINPVGRAIPLSIAGKPIASILLGDPTQTISNQGIAKQETILLSLSIVEGFSVNTGDLPPVAMTDGHNLTASDAGTNDVVLNDLLEHGSANLRLGDTIVLSSPDGAAQKTLTIVGFFSRVRTTDFVPGEVLVDAPLASTLGGNLTQDLIALKVPTNQVPAVRQQLNQLAPGALVVSLTDLNAIFDLVLNNLIEMMTAIASLAVIAGIIIIANAVALAMLERRREIGILKSLGHTSRSILAMVLIENGLLGLLGSLVAMTLVIGGMLALGAIVFQRNLQISYLLAGSMVAITIGIAVSVAMLVSWSATRRRPLEVLRYE